MKLISSNQGLFIFCSLIVMTIFLSSCNTKSSNEKIGFFEFYLDMDYTKVKSTMDSLLKAGDLNYYETTDLLGNTQKNLYKNISEINPSLYAKVNLRGAYPLNTPGSDNQKPKSDIHEADDSTSAPIIYYDFGEAYMYEILDKASGINQTK